MDASGKGELWSFVVFHQNYFDGMKDELPYPVVMVKLNEGPYLLTNIEGMTISQLAIGMRMSVRFVDGPDGFVLPQFGPEA
ncbi:MAG: OB-fold domain-containing protein [Acetobacteraceae bacterium]